MFFIWALSVIRQSDHCVSAGFTLRTITVEIVARAGFVVNNSLLTVQFSARNTKKMLNTVLKRSQVHMLDAVLQLTESCSVRGI